MQDITALPETKTVNLAVTAMPFSGSISEPVWQFPENAQKNKWYLAIYFSDPVPYVVKTNGETWRDNFGKIVSIPMRIKAVGEFPKIKPVKEKE